MAQTTIAVAPRDRCSDTVRTILGVLGAPPAGFRLVMVDAGALGALPR